MSAARGRPLKLGSGTGPAGGVKLSVLDLPFLPEELRDVLPDGDPVGLTLGT